PKRGLFEIVTNSDKRGPDALHCASKVVSFVTFIVLRSGIRLVLRDGVYFMKKHQRRRSPA
ncbi:MAG TPA: hypothetical protein VGH38_12275, partial [Bryobacteraceae bacterium]